MNLDILKNLAIFIGAVVALFTLIKGFVEYSKHNAMKRAEYFFELLEELYRILETTHIGELLENNSSKISDVSYNEKYKFLGFFEKIALMMKSGLIRKEIVHYMFSYYAILCYNNKIFWQSMNKKSPFWSLFCEFSEQMIEFQKKLESDKTRTKRLRF
ncbi:MAG: hypothetical protein FD122_493 [Stygiobacter sp.]|nr:MAG: hypothetical protein FD122_493 [Stygiobacter sp.]KAF0212572.1 MAG: hypothetical protein FD178_3126 [Ignavibacteria bacterium]